MIPAKVPAVSPNFAFGCKTLYGSNFHQASSRSLLLYFVLLLLLQLVLILFILLLVTVWNFLPIWGSLLRPISLTASFMKSPLKNTHEFTSSYCTVTATTNIQARNLCKVGLRPLNQGELTVVSRVLVLRRSRWRAPWTSITATISVSISIFFNVVVGSFFLRWRALITYFCIVFSVLHTVQYISAVVTTIITGVRRNVAIARMNKKQLRY